MKKSAIVLLSTVLSLLFLKVVVFQNVPITRVVGALIYSAKHSCTVPKIDHIPPGSALIIGHAYGSPGGTNSFISEKTNKFIRTHALLLDGVIFSGDVFRSPSVAKWNRLVRFSNEIGVEFRIAPGNHDVGYASNNLRDIWNRTLYRLANNSDVALETNGFAVFLEDSVKTGWQMDSKLIESLHSTKIKKPIVLIRHNIAINEMLDISNSRAGLKGSLPDAAELSEKLPKRLIVVSGDTGAFKQLPRITCFKENGVTFIATGIGDIDQDTVLVMSNGELYQMPI